MEKEPAEDYLFVSNTDRVLHDCTPEADWQQRLEDDYNSFIDYLVTGGRYTYEEGEEFKRAYHRGLYGE